MTVLAYFLLKIFIFFFVIFWCGWGKSWDFTSDTVWSPNRLIFQVDFSKPKKYPYLAVDASALSGPWDDGTFLSVLGVDGACGPRRVRCCPCSRRHTLGVVSLGGRRWVMGQEGAPGGTLEAPAAASQGREVDS